MNKIIVFKFIITYLFCATILLFNLLFNTNVQWKFIDKQTNEIRDVPSIVTIIFCCAWIYGMFSLIIRKNEK